ncbi:MAG: thymidine phosphorylase, partial [Planctomycetota bacterium]
GGGRRVMSDSIDRTVGIETLVSLGDHIERGQPIARIFAKHDDGRLSRERLRIHFQIQDEPAAKPPLVLDRYPDLP